ncbi:3-oxoacyl-(acyl-carrier-protein) reductase [Sphingobium chlorophenolicum L-1]|uniref:3-oxoacyl-(Acyl-carrier-protein) reductase n=1 Tax=Sphingobium chlorophenolicum L-1 TaxID=690566 RepID=F6EUH8_SPHCR|nr:SDR family NAD(P)-dependent oxidoreductase [Sphingobium chlorophenolicum]AEG47872.1 3-oxoacyl-(acyl-carrier-protein) reductase [Sphingobium chlorophenolicum L-1]
MSAPSPQRFEGQTVVVVGGTRGLGFQYASDLAAQGANVVLTGRSDDIADIASQAGAKGGQVVGVQCDIRQPAIFVDAALANFRRIDGLIINAGIVRDRSFGRMTLDEWTEVIDVHLGGSFASAKAVWPIMVDQGGGSILFTTSGAGLHGAFGQANYAAAKAGIIGLAKTLAIEGARAKIRVNAIAPMANTEMTDSVFDERLRDGLKVDQVSPFALSLIHPDCALSGQVIECGGGWAAAMRWQRSLGATCAAPVEFSHVLENLEKVVEFGSGYDLPRSTADSLGAALGDPRQMINR